jgi:5'-nucleotidase
MKKQAFFITVFFVWTCVGWAQEKPVLTLLHTNDTHSQVEPLNTKEYQNVGGFARRSAFVDKVRSEDVPVLLVDAGDFSQGSPYFNFYGGKVEVRLMNLMKYDAVALGNHEFDNGTHALAKRLRKAKFPVLCANYVFKDLCLARKVKPYTILKKGNLKIGIFGLLTDLQGLVSPNILTHLSYQDPVRTSMEIVNLLKHKQKCDLIVCLSHLGIAPEEPNAVTDTLLAREVPDIDIIVGGHTHQWITQPIMIGKTRVLQLDFGGVRIGKLDIYKD